MDAVVLAPEAQLKEAPPAEPRLPDRLYALKDGDVFLVSDDFGDIHGGADGLFRHDTRLLSRFQLSLGGTAPALLSAAVSRDNVFFTSHATNRPVTPIGGVEAPQGVIHLERRRLLWKERLYERLTFRNFGEEPAQAPLSLTFAADFRDIFEVRGQARERRGESRPPALGEASVEFAYCGLDGVDRRAVLAFSELPAGLGEHEARFDLTVPPGGAVELYLEVGDRLDERPSRARFRRAAAAARWAMRRRLRSGARVRSSGRLFNGWLDKSRADLALLVSDLPTGPYPYAGIPWFSTTFGRDALIAAWHMLWLDPSLARGVLAYLASRQATEHSAFRDAAPGKILHEVRKGEMAARGEVPFACYYGGVDTTCLFVALAAAYAARTGDAAFIDELWPALLAAVRWMEGFGRDDPDGLVTYAREADSGLVNQGWKDSHDSVFHADGRAAEGPIALVEVQGYAFAAFHGMADLARRRGEDALAAAWAERAERLRAAVERRFWMDDQQFYGLALDGRGELCRVRASNAGHLLFVGLPSQERGEAVARQLTGPDFASGWGLRTLAAGQRRYNPVSYHNGSVWPHDTALCLAGLRRYGSGEDVVRVLSHLFEAAVHFDMRLPELFCGFPRIAGEPPVAYPVACLPQAWAATSAFAVLQACLGLSLDGWRGEIRVDAPRLPLGVGSVNIRGLQIGGRTVDLHFEQLHGRVMVVPGANDEGAVPLITHT